MSVSTVSSGATSSGFVVSATGALTVLSGGDAVGTVVSAGGLEQVSAGGVVSGTLVSFGGQEAVGGTAVGTLDLGTQAVIAGGSAINTVVLVGSETVGSGGVTSGSLVGSGFSDGIEIVEAGGLAVSTTVGGAAGQLTVSSGGTSLGAVIAQGGYETVFGLASGSVISGGTEFVAGGVAAATVIAGSGTLALEVGSSAEGGIAFAGSGGALIVEAPFLGAATMPATPISGFAATDRIDLQGVTYTSAATASFDAGVLTVSAGGAAYTLELPDLPDGTTFALQPDAGLGTLVLLQTGSGATVSSGAISSGFVVSATGALTVLSGGSALSTAVEGYGTLAVSAGGDAVGTVVSAGGLEQVSAGGVVSGTLVSFGGQEAVGGTAVGTLDLGTQAVIAGGSAINTVVLVGSETVGSGGVTSGSLVGSGFSDGIEIVEAGGLAVSTTVGGAAGQLTVSSGGTSLGAVIAQGGYETVFGLASGSVISGGTEFVAGGVAAATVIAGSGTLALEVGSSAEGGIAFAGSGGALIVEAPFLGAATMPATPISGFAATDRIDLQGVTYTSAATASFDAGVLTVSAGGAAYTLELPDLPDGTTFALQPDAGLGTLVLLQTGSGATVSSGAISSGFVVSATGALTVLSGGSALSTAVEGYGTLAVSAGGDAVGTVVSAGGLEQVSAGGVVSGTLVSFGGQEAVGGTAVGTLDLGTQAVIAGGSAINTVVLVGSETVGSGGVTSGSLVGSGFSDGIEIVEAGGLAVSTTVGGAAGQLTVSSGGTSLGAVIAQGGYETVFGLASGSVISGGTEFVAGGVAAATVIAGSGTLALEVGSSAEGGIAFAGSGGALIVEAPFLGAATMPATPISGFAATDRIDLQGVTYTSAATARFAAGVLTVSAGGAAYTLDLPDLPDGTTFALQPDAGLGTLVLASDIPCFAAGTRIRTETGDIAVEDLKPGDRIVTRDGPPQPITWIGHRHVRPARHPRPQQVRPVRIEAHAFGPNEPQAALRLSPDHAIFAEGVLIPVKHLINGETILQVDVESITYFHIELAEHAVVLAEGLPAESYLDAGDRPSFAASAVTQLHPDFGLGRRDAAFLWDALACAPLRVMGREVELVRARLAARAAARRVARSTAASRR
jgi:autotransporter passenger strand-loop-strand repeat protein